MRKEWHFLVLYRTELLSHIRKKLKNRCPVMILDWVKVEAHAWLRAAGQLSFPIVSCSPQRPIRNKLQYRKGALAHSYRRQQLPASAAASIRTHPLSPMSSFWCHLRRSQREVQTEVKSRKTRQKVYEGEKSQTKKCLWDTCQMTQTSDEGTKRLYFDL